MIKKVSATLLGLASLLGVYANEVIGISADRYEDSFDLSEVMSLKFHEEEMISVNLYDGNKNMGYQTIVFQKDKPQAAPNITASLDDAVSTEQANITVYPNPVEKVLYVNGLAEDSDIKVISLTGEVIKQVKAQEVDVENLPKGVYILNVNDRMVKFIKK
ncbi:MAG: T9SS type A sorting domain-containing protein [Paludibacteraceae bacterium]|nr:T9SS type A sorting domain-containing protein [Paludibacteraceae bacterium]